TRIPDCIGSLLVMLELSFDEKGPVPKPAGIGLPLFRLKHTQVPGLRSERVFRFKIHGIILVEAVFHVIKPPANTRKDAALASRDQPWRVELPKLQALYPPSWNSGFPIGEMVINRLSAIDQ